MRGLKVKDVMTSRVVTVHPDTRFKDVIRLMAKHGVAGVPVVDGEGAVVGIVTESDLLAVEDRSGARRLRRARGRRLTLPEDARARDLMTGRPVTVPSVTPLVEAARLMQQVRVKRLPVVDRGSLVGIVSREDLLRPFLRDDEEIRADVLDLAEQDLLLDPSRIIVRVRDGLVSLVGTVSRRSDRDLLVERVHAVPGVVGAQENLAYEVDDRHTRTRPTATSRVRTGSLPKDFVPGSLRGR
ncbi:MAG TPA: CBS domain-containing protein [Actinomycetota bacterium]|nr:CBS domain-containing protein [Actinomycetota bacterium]